MEGLARLVTESLARHNFETTVDHRRLQWSGWFRCEDTFSVLLVPSQPGIFALGEELIAPGDVSATGGKRMLALFQVTESEDLGMALGRLFLPGTPLRERLANGRCFVRYAIIEDAAPRHAAHAAFQQWMASSSEFVSGVASQVFSAEAPAPMKSSNEEARIGLTSPLPSGF